MKRHADGWGNYLLLRDTFVAYFSWHYTHVSKESWDSVFNQKDMRAKDLKYTCHASRLLFVADALRLHFFFLQLLHATCLGSFILYPRFLPDPSCRRLTWNLKIIPSKRKIIFLPNHHFLGGVIQFRGVWWVGLILRDNRTWGGPAHRCASCWPRQDPHCYRASNEFHWAYSDPCLPVPEHE